MNIQDYLRQRYSPRGMSKLANFFGRGKSPKLRDIIDKASGGNLPGAAKDLVMHKEPRQKALSIAQQMKRQGRLNKPELQGAGDLVPDKMPGMMQLPGFSKKTVSFLQKHRGNPSFKKELKAILQEARSKA